MGGDASRPPLQVAKIYNFVMKFDPQKHHRRSIRLKGFDYAGAGAYYVTIVAWRRECLFGEVVNGEIMLSQYGEIVQKWWEEIPVHFSNVETGAFVIMPNHVHGIVFITERSPMIWALMNWAWKPRPNATQPWDKSLRISNINPQKK